MFSRFALLFRNHKKLFSPFFAQSLAIALLVLIPLLLFPLTLKKSTPSTQNRISQVVPTVIPVFLSPTLNPQLLDFEYTRQLLENLVYQENPQAAMEKLRELTQKDATILANCHPLTHIVGQAAYQKYNNISEALRYSDEYCGSGYIQKTRPLSGIMRQKSPECRCKELGVELSNSGLTSYSLPI